MTLQLKISYQIVLLCSFIGKWTDVRSSIRVLFLTAYNGKVTAIDQLVKMNNMAMLLTRTKMLTPISDCGFLPCTILHPIRDVYISTFLTYSITHAYASLHTTVCDWDCIGFWDLLRKHVPSTQADTSASAYLDLRNRSLALPLHLWL